MSFRINTIYSIANKFINVGFTFLTLVLVARVLEPEGQGKYSLLVQVSRTFFYFFSLGVPVSFVFYFGQNKKKRQELIRTFFFAYSTLAVLGLVAGLSFAKLGHNQFFEGIELQALIIGCLGIPLWFMNSFSSSIFSGLERFKQLNIIQVVQPAVLLCSVVTLILVGKLNVQTAILSYILSLALNLVLNLYFLKRDSFKLKFFSSRVEWSFLKNSYRYSFKTYLGSVSEFLIYKVDIYIISFFLTKSSLGLYIIAVNVVERLWMISESVSNVLFAKLVNEHDEKKRNFFTIYTLQGTFLVSLLGSIGLGSLGQIFVEIIFGSSYSQTTTYIYILLPGVVLQSTALMIKKVLEARGCAGTNARASVSCLALNICLNLILIPKVGVPGAAFSTSITYITYFFVQARSLKKKFGITKRSFMLLGLKDLKFLYSSIVKR